MKREIIKTDNEKQWLNLRKKDITSTMSSALFDLSPYMTALELYHAKRDEYDPEFQENDRMAKGKRMEEYAAREICLEHGFESLRRMDEYIRIPELRIGSSFDFEIVCPKRGLGILEIKAVDYAQFKEKWEQDEAPAHIEVQVQHQLMTAGDQYNFVDVGAFYSVYDHHLLSFEPDREFHSGLRNAIAKFWYDVENGNKPEPDYYRDSDLIKSMYDINDDEYADYTKDEKISLLCKKYMRLKGEEKGIKKDIKATQAEIMETLGGKKGGFTQDHKISIIEVKDSPAKIITKEMVGQEIGGRRGYKRLNVKSV